MEKVIDITVAPERINDYGYIKKIALEKAGLPNGRIKILKRSVDARHKPVYRIKAAIYTGKLPEPEPPAVFKNTEDAKPVFIAGAGPAGLFAALQLLILGVKPVIFERGKDVDSRKKDIKDLELSNSLKADSNYCFGEGGAGAFSDGKLYTRAVKRGSPRQVLDLLVKHGASPEILIDSRPHIGSDALPEVIKSIRKTIIGHGGEINFNSYISSLTVKEEKLVSVTINEKEKIPCSALILATGHSAASTYRMLHNQGITLESKPFAVGVRVEHRQQVIDSIQYGSSPRPEGLPPASYVLKSSFKGRGVYSFCMCPGGMIIPSSTSERELVLNGMSPSGRNLPFANAAIVTQVSAEDFGNGVFAGLEFREKLESDAFNITESLTAPAQRLADFVNGKKSETLPESSYPPGITSFPLAELFPGYVTQALIKGFKDFSSKMKGFLTQEAVLLAPETRTSSPVRIPRNKTTLMHPVAEGLFPCGEGAGYSGGILSSALDGIKCALAAQAFIQ